MREIDIVIVKGKSVINIEMRQSSEDPIIVSPAMAGEIIATARRLLDAHAPEWDSSPTGTRMLLRYSLAS